MDNKTCWTIIIWRSENIQCVNWLINWTKSNKETFEQWTKNNCTTIADLKIQEKEIESLLKKKDDNNCLLRSKNNKDERLDEIKEIKSLINALMDERKEKQNYSQQ